MPGQDIPDTIFEAWRLLAISREGYRNTVYKDSDGRPSWGIGFLVLPADNLKLGDYVSNDRIETEFEKRSLDAYKKALDQSIILQKTSKNFIVALLSASYQLGDFSQQFPTTFALLKANAWQGAIENLKSSLWMQETPTRVNDLITAIQEAYTPSLWQRFKNSIGV